MPENAIVLQYMMVLRIDAVGMSSVQDLRQQLLHVVTCELYPVRFRAYYSIVFFMRQKPRKCR